jgi:STE24 endopeptidase
MDAPDPRTVAGAWLSRIPAAQRAAAHTLTDLRLAVWLAAGAATILLCVAMTRADALGRLRRALEMRGPRPWLVGAAGAAALALVLGTARAVIDAVGAWRAEPVAASVGWGAPRGWGAHLAESAAQIPATVVWAVVLAPLLGWLVRRRPASWPLLAGGGFAAASVALIWLPYALSLGPTTTVAPPTPARDGVAQLIASTGLPAQGVGLATDPGFDADVTGAFGRAKVVLGPALAAGPPAEARAYVGHLMGHYVHGDVLAVSLILGAAAIAGGLAAQRWTAPLARGLGAARAASPADAEALPALAIIALCVVAVGGAAESAYLRWANVRADAYSLDHARAPDGLAAVLVREWDHQSLDPNPLEAALFYTHPPLPGRLVHAMRWKADHGD